MLVSVMNNVLPLSEKANRFAAIDDVSDHIFEEISPNDPVSQPDQVDRNRVRTRLLDFAFYMRGVVKEDGKSQSDRRADGANAQNITEAPEHADGDLTYGWLVVVDGPGRGRSFPLYKEITRVGRGTDQDVRLDFGDDFVSRRAHVTIHHEQDRGLVAVRCGEKHNPVLLNGRLFSGTRLLKHKSRVTIGQTTLRFVAIDDHDAFWSV